MLSERVRECCWGAPEETLISLWIRRRRITMANKPWLRTRAHFLTAGDEAELRTLTTGQRGRLTHYRIREVLPVRGEAPVALVDGWRMVCIETPTPFSLSEDLLLPDGSSSFMESRSICSIPAKSSGRNSTSTLAPSWNQQGTRPPY